MAWEMVAGLEIHARIKTDTKMFCGCPNSFGEQANSTICPVCAGFPGALPAVNQRAIELGVQTALALGCEIPKFCKFDRKSYFYPDLPSGFQISQFDLPISEHGKVEFYLDGEKRSVRINRLHLENDAGKLTHAQGGSLVDLNRAGAPLMEMVTEADFRSPAEMGAFLKELQKILRTVGSSHADMEKGQMRCDVNISLRPEGQKEFGTKTELKNMNSFSNIMKAATAEIKRQQKILESGGEIAQETRGWDVDKEVSVSQRSKEEAADYRYFPEPDLPPLTFTDEYVAAKKAELPELPSAKFERYLEHDGLSAEMAEIVAGNPVLSTYVDTAISGLHKVKKGANFIVVDYIGYLNDQGIDLAESKLTAGHMHELLKLIEDGVISGKIAKDIMPDLVTNGESPRAYVETKGLIQQNDDGAITEWCQQVLDANPQAIEDFKNGREKALGALVGQIMKLSQGKANPQMVNQKLRELIG